MVVSKIKGENVVKTTKIYDKNFIIEHTLEDDEKISIRLAFGTVSEVVKNFSKINNKIVDTKYNDESSKPIKNIIRVINILMDKIEPFKVLDFNNIDIDRLDFKRDIDLLSTVKVGNINMSLEYEIKNTYRNNIFTKIFFKKYNKLKSLKYGR